MDNQPQGRIMALDLGEKRIGVAVSDELRMVAKSYGVIKRKSRQEDFARYSKIAAEQGVTLIVVGLPVPLGGVEGEKAAWVRDYSTEMAQSIHVPVTFWDEALTTVQAEAALREQGVKRKRARKRVDAVAAAFILQSYLDALRQD